MLDLWFRDDVVRVLASIEQSHKSTVDASDRPPDGDYLRGYADALRAVRVGFGVLPVVTRNDPGAR